ncbi:MAG: glycosyltransferase [bacterium]|nr:glycosyltransferase [Candidatus Sumerlaeota bacterium]
MKTAIEGQTFSSPDARRGIGVYLRSLLGRLPLITRHDYIMSRWGSPPPGLPPEEILPTQRLSAGSLMRDQGFESQFHRRNAAIRRFLREIHCGLLFNPNPLQLCVEAVSRCGGIPLVATLHDLTPLAPDSANPAFSDAAQEREYRWRLDHLLRHADHFIVHTNTTSEDAQRLLGIDASRITVAPCGVADIFSAQFEPEKHIRTLDRLGLTDYAGSYLLLAGGCHPKNNPGGLFKALGMLRDSFLYEHPVVVAGPIGDVEWANAVALATRECPTARLVRAGDLGDTELVSLYSCALALVYVSLHEDFGLSLLEAMACGCPVIASNTGSVAEVAGDAARLCDSASPAAISGAISEVESSDTLQEELIEKGYRRAGEFSWSTTAAKTAMVFDKFQPRAAVRAAAATAHPRLAWFSPLPPEPGGISAYSVSMLEHLADRFQIYVVHDTPDLILPPSLQRIQRLKPGEFDTAQYADCLRIYNMGNHVDHHALVWSWLRRRPGITIAHDLNIHGFLLDHLVRARRRPVVWRFERFARGGIERDEYFRALREAHGEAGAHEAWNVLALGAMPDIARYPCHRLLTSSSLAVAAHSRWACDELELNADASLVRHMPLGIEHPLTADKARIRSLRESLSEGSGDLLLVCAGFLEPSRRVDIAVRAVAWLLERRTRARLVLVGEITPSHREQLVNLAAELGVADRVIFRGYVASGEEFAAHLHAADVVIHLRQPTSGESSATVLRALSAGRPVIASNADAFQDLPDSCCWKLDHGSGEADLLTEYLYVLARRSDVRAAMSGAARAFIVSNHTWPLAAGAFADIVGEVQNSMRPWTASIR